MEVIDEDCNVEKSSAGINFMRLVKTLHVPIALCEVTSNSSDQVDSIKLLEANDALIKLCKSDYNLIKNRDIEFLFPDFGPNQFDAVKQALSTGSSVTIENKVKFGNRILSVTLTPYNNNIISLVLEDVTDVSLKSSDLFHGSSSEIMNIMPDIIMVFNRDGVYVDYHAASLEDLPIPADKFLGCKLNEFLPRKVAAQFHEKLKEALATGHTSSFRHDVIIDRKSNTFDVKFLPNQKGEVICIVRNITGMDRVGLARDISKDKFKAIFESTPAGISLINDKMHIVLANEAVESITGFSRKYLAGKILCDLTHPDDITRCRENYLDVLHGKVSRHNFVKRIICSDSKVKWIQAAVSPLYNISGKISYVVETITDISEQRQSREKLGRIQRRLRELNTVAKSGYWEVDYRNGNITCDQELYDLFGYPVDIQLDLDFIRSRIHSDDIFNTERAFIKAIKENTDFNILHRFYDSRGCIKHIVHRGTTEYDENMRPRRTIGMAYDITELHEAQMELEKSNRILHAIITSTHKLLEHSEIQQAFSESLKALCAALDVSRAYVYLVTELDSGALDCRYAYDWTSPDVINLAELSGKGDYVIYDPEIIRNLHHNKATVLDLSTVPEEHRDLMIRCETKSLAALPVFINNRLHGFIGIDDCKNMRHWGNAELTILKLFAETSGMIIERREREIKLEETVKRAENNEALLLKSETRLRSLLKTLPDMIFIYDKHGYILDYSVTDTSDLVATPEEFLGQHLSKILPDHVSELKTGNIRQSLAIGDTCHYQYELDIDGDIRLFDARMVPYGSDTTMEIVRNITEQHRIKSALESSENKFRLLFDRMISGATLFEPEFDKQLHKWRYRFIDANSSYEQMNGIERERFIGHFIDDIFPEMESSWLDVLHEVAHNGNSKVFELYHSETGKHYHCSAFKPEPTQNYFCVIFNDLTAQKKFEIDLIKAKEKAEESDRLKSSFLSNMSHEIRTPLNTIVGLSNLMAENDLNRDEKGEYAALINQSSNQLLTLITDIIDIAKIESGQLSLNKSNININALLEKLYDIFSAKLHRKNQTNIDLITRSNLNDVDATVFTDETRLTQIYSNLLDNALKFTSQGIIEFGYELDIESNELICYVKDSGTGIAPEKQDIIFERFRQADDSFTRKYGGTGLGLTICKNLCDLMGGRIWLTSEEGNGSCFSFTLPYVRKDETPSQKIKRLAVHSENAMFSWPGKTVMIVEDTPTVQFYLKRILELANVKCLIASNGQEAVEYVEEGNSVDLVLMDIQMPVLNGFDATRKLKELDPYLPIIAQTAYAFASEMEKIAECGCDDCIVKPIRKNQLLKKLSTYFGPSVPVIDYNF